MVTAAYFQTLLHQPKTVLCVLSTASALLLSACSSAATDTDANPKVEATKIAPVATTVVVVSKDTAVPATTTANAISANPNASDAPSKGASAKRIYVSVPKYEGSAWSQADEDAYLKALQETDLVFDENSKQLIHVKDATPIRTIIYQQNGIVVPAKNNDDAMNSTPAGEQPAADKQSQSSQEKATSSTSPTASTSLLEVVALASAEQSAASSDASLDKPITPVTKPVRVSSVRDTQNHWQKSATPCRNCSNYYDYDPVYYEPFYQKFPTPGVDTK